MAKGNTRFPISGLEGGQGRTDRTRGLTGGIGLSYTETPSGTILGASGDHSKTKSTAQKSRAGTYCGCDDYWKRLGRSRQYRTRGWWMLRRNLVWLRLPDYQCWMQACLGDPVAATLYRGYRWAGRYILVNDTGAVMHPQDIYLTGVVGLQPGTGMHRVVRVRPDLSYSAPVFSRFVGLGVVRVMNPDLQPATSCTWDVYSAKEG